MKRLGYLIGLTMIWLLGIVILIGFIAKNGWAGAGFLAFLGVALFLIAYCSPDDSR